MPSAKELQRGIRLGVYRDVEKEQRDERRVQVAEDRLNLADQREQRVAQNDDERLRLDRLRFTNDEVKARAAAAAEARVLEDSIAATNELSQVRADTDDFPTKYQSIVGKYPRALADKAFQEQAKWNQDIHQGYRTQRTAAEKLAVEQRLKDAEKQAERLEIERLRTEGLKTAERMGLKPKGGSVTDRGFSPAFEAPEVDKALDSAVTVQEVTGEDGTKKITATRKLPANEVEAAQRATLLSRHNELEAGLLSKSGVSAPTTEEIKAINVLKGQLGYRMLDASGRAVQEAPGQSAVAPSAPERVATNPQTGEKLAFRNGKWVPL